jgi:periplasmic copper chaperone A
MEIRCSAVLLLSLLTAQSLAQTGDARAGNLQVSEAWSRPTPPAAAVGVVYFSITNLGSKEDLLLGGLSPVASKIELHESRRSQGIETMRAVASLSCPPGATVRSEPGAVHVMLLGLAHPLLAGASFPLTLQFRDAGDVTLQVAVVNRQ